MTYTNPADHHVPAPLPGEIAATIGAIRSAGRYLAAFAENLASAVRIKLRERRSRRLLSELDDRMLKDIGVHRAEIPHVARRAALARGVGYGDFRNR